MFVVKLDAGWNAASVIGDGDGIVGMNGDKNIVAVSCKSLIDSVIHHFKYHVVQTGTIGSIADVHAWTFANRLQPFQLLDT